MTARLAPAIARAQDGAELPPHRRARRQRADDPEARLRAGAAGSGEVTRRSPRARDRVRELQARGVQRERPGRQQRRAARARRGTAPVLVIADDGSFA